MYPALAAILASVLISRFGPKNKGPKKPDVPFTAAVWSILVPVGVVLLIGVLAGQIYLLP